MSDVLRPRDEFDIDVHPETVRGKVLSLYDAVDDAKAKMRAGIARLPWYRRWPIRAYLRVKRVRL